MGGATTRGDGGSQWEREKERGVRGGVRRGGSAEESLGFSAASGSNTHRCRKSLAFSLLGPAAACKLPQFSENALECAGKPRSELFLSLFFKIWCGCASMLRTHLEERVFTFSPNPGDRLLLLSGFHVSATFLQLSGRKEKFDLK